MHDGYRVQKRNLQVVKLVDFENAYENKAQNSSPTCKHNLFALIERKKMFLKYLALWESLTLFSTTWGDDHPLPKFYKYSFDINNAQ